MLTAVRKVFFTVAADGSVPATPQWAGVQGEHNATEVVFEIPAHWVQAGYRFHAEWIDGVQGGYVSEALFVQDNTVGVLLPKNWTEAGGIGELRLVAQLQGDTEENSQIVYTSTARLSFLTRSGIIE